MLPGAKQGESALESAIAARYTRAVQAYLSGRDPQPGLIKTGRQHRLEMRVNADDHDWSTVTATLGGRAGEKKGGQYCCSNLEKSWVIRGRERTGVGVERPTERRGNKAEPSDRAAACELKKRRRTSIVMHKGNAGLLLALAGREKGRARERRSVCGATSLGGKTSLDEDRATKHWGRKRMQRLNKIVEVVRGN